MDLLGTLALTGRPCRSGASFYLSLLADLTASGLGSPWLSSNRFLVFDLALGAPSDRGPLSSERPALQRKIRGQGSLPQGAEDALFVCLFV